MFLELGDKTQQGKERFPFFYIICSVSYFLIGICVSDKTRNGCELGDKNVAMGHSAFTWCTGHR